VSRRKARQGVPRGQDQLCRLELLAQQRDEQAQCYHRREQLHKRSHNPYLVASRLADRPTPMPWFGNKHLFIRFA
jgi:hypothetical protein